jgi:reactive intermediate/imine deaminase
MKKIIYSPQAPAAAGTYSQAVRVGDIVYVSGQLGLVATTGELAIDFEAQCHEMFKNLRSICEAAGATLNDVVKISLFLTDLSYFTQLNEIMGQYIAEPYPARATVQVAALPKGGMVEADVVVYKPL